MSVSAAAGLTVGITGASGYLGSCVAGAFRSEGWQVRALSRRQPPGGEGIHFVLGEAVQAASLRGLRALVHCAYDFSLTRPKEIRRVNVEGSRHLFAAAREAAVPYLVYISSISAFRGCRSEYGRAKLAIEEEALTAGALVVRPGLIWGDPPGSTFGNLVAQVNRSRVIPLIGDGSQIQYLVHKDDLAGSIVGYCAGRISGIDVPVTVANSRPWPFADLLRAIGRGIGREPRMVPTPWWAIWGALKAAEGLRIPLKFRSDSVVSLMSQNPAPDFRVADRLGLECRAFPTPD